MSYTSHSHSRTHAHEPHAVPPSVLLAVFAALLVLTALTVGVTYVDLGALNIWIALGIAVVKAALVALYFMHLRYDSPFNGVILIAALVFVVLFIGLAILDTRAYQPDFVAPSGASIR